MAEDKIVFTQNAVGKLMMESFDIFVSRGTRYTNDEITAYGERLGRNMTPDLCKKNGGENGA